MSEPDAAPAHLGPAAAPPIAYWEEWSAPPEVQCFLEGPQRRRSELAWALRIFRELLRGFRAFHFLGPCVTVFGSARFVESHPYYRLARQLGSRLAEAGFTRSGTTRAHTTSVTRAPTRLNRFLTFGRRSSPM